MSIIHKIPKTEGR